MLVIDQLSVTYTGQAKPALKELCGAWDTAGISAIVGRSGVGKSTLLQCVAGIQCAGLPTIERYEGRILVDGEAPWTVRGPERVSWVPQTPTLFNHLTVLENVLLPMEAVGATGEHCIRAAARLIDGFGLGDYGNSRPNQLSGGMRARVSFARALVSEPRYLYLDEPFGGLDLSNRWELYRVMRAERSVAERSTIFTSHNLPEAALIADRIIVVSAERDISVVRVVENMPTLVLRESASACLERARRRATDLEAEVFLATVTRVD